MLNQVAFHIWCKINTKTPSVNQGHHQDILCSLEMPHLCKSNCNQIMNFWWVMLLWVSHIHQELCYMSMWPEWVKPRHYILIHDRGFSSHYRVHYRCTEHVSLPKNYPLALCLIQTSGAHHVLPNQPYWVRLTHHTWVLFQPLDSDSNVSLLGTWAHQSSVATPGATKFDLGKLWWFQNVNSGYRA